MNQLNFPLLSLILWLPAVGSLVLLCMPKLTDIQSRRVALSFAFITFFLSLLLPLGFDSLWPLQASAANVSPLQFQDRIPWIPAWGVSYWVGVDGVSLWLVVLTCTLNILSVLAGWKAVSSQIRYFYSLLLLEGAAITGVFVAQDIFFFYLFWEMSLIPMTFLIGIWGSTNRIRAATKFFIYTFSGSIVMLAGIVALYFLHRNASENTIGSGEYLFALPNIMRDLNNGVLRFDPNTERLLFGCFFAAFAVKVPIWPFHTWLSDAHTEAPTAGSVELAGILLKLGAYGLLRFGVGLFPMAVAWAAPAVGILASIGIIYGAFVAYTQSDMKRIIAYSSVSHMGFVVLGIFSMTVEGMSGALLQMIAHGLTSGGMFLLIGMINRRYETRQLDRYSGLWSVMPRAGGFALFLSMALIGLPGLSGFVGEYMIMQGTYRSATLGPAFALVCVVGVALSAVYMLHLFRAVFMGEPKVPRELDEPRLKQLTFRETFMMSFIAVFVVLIGLLPNLLLGPMQVSIRALARLGGQILGVQQ